MPLSLPYWLSLLPHNRYACGPANLVGAMIRTRARVRASWQVSPLIDIQIYVPSHPLYVHAGVYVCVLVCGREGATYRLRCVSI